MLVSCMRHCICETRTKKTLAVGSIQPNPLGAQLFFRTAERAK
jgi:hypothetical protein